MRTLPVLLALALVTTSSCRPLPAPASSAQAPAPGNVSRTERELSALLLLLGDRRLYEPYSASRALSGDAGIRAELARAVGRSGDPRGRTLLEELLLDRDPEVAADAAFGLGLLGSERSVDALMRCARHCGEVAAGQAVAALGRLGAPLVVVAEGLGELPEEQRWARLAPGLQRFAEPASVDLAVVASGAADSSVRLAAAAVLAEATGATVAEAARRLLEDPDPEIRRVAALALGRAGRRDDLEALSRAFDDAEGRVVAGALEGAARLVGSGRAAADAALSASVAAHLVDPRAPARLGALEVAGAFLDDPLLAAELERVAREGSAWQRHLALRALARAGLDIAAPYVAADRVAADPVARASAAEVGALLGQAPTAAALADGDPRVRQAARRARFELARASERPALAAADLADSDLGVREAMLEHLEREPLVSTEVLAGVLATATGSRGLPVRLAALRAIAVRGRAERLELGAAVLALEAAFRDGDHATRRAAQAALATLDRPAPAALGARETTWTAAQYREVLDQAAVAPSRYRLVTSRGEAMLRLDCEEVPLSCHFFRQLAGQGYYDGTQVVSNAPGASVVLGDPRGDGRGGAGFRVADEPTRRPVVRGTVGLIAASGPDSAAGPLFVATSATPRLDGSRALLGQIESGLEVIEGLEPGDRLLRIEAAR